MCILRRGLFCLVVVGCGWLASGCLKGILVHICSTRSLRLQCSSAPMLQLYNLCLALDPATASSTQWMWQLKILLFGKILDNFNVIIHFF